jgi:hypothetical protein
LPAFFVKKSQVSSTLSKKPMTKINLTPDQAKRIIAVAPKDSPYYQEAQRVLFAKGYVPSLMNLDEEYPPVAPGT